MPIFYEFYTVYCMEDKTKYEIKEHQGQDALFKNGIPCRCPHSACAVTVPVVVKKNLALNNENPDVQMRIQMITPLCVPYTCALANMPNDSNVKLCNGDVIQL